MNLIYICIFHQQTYINLLKLLLNSIKNYGNINTITTDILIITTNEFKPLIENIGIEYGINLKYYILNINSLFDAGCARLHIFDYEYINTYEKILYLDTDILINNNIDIIFELNIENNKIYTLEEGIIGHEYWGGQFFNLNKFDRNMSAFTSGILFFANSDELKELFKKIKEHIYIYIKIQNNPIPICLDQPFIVYNSINENKYENQLFKIYTENNPTNIEDKVIYHFPGGPGNYQTKYDKMLDFSEKMYIYHKNKNV
jgi:lipopolysaccharide biosynthesis glycosyltransferase